MLDLILALHGGWSKDCIWISSSFTMPLAPGPTMFDATRPSPVASGDADNPLRSPPIASISSMKPIAPPSLRANFRRVLKNDRIRAPVMPYHMDWNDGAEMNKNGTPACFAIAFARYVFPVPG